MRQKKKKKKKGKKKLEKKDKQHPCHQNDKLEEDDHY
jgi:hypothetical protein